ncbi:MAG: lipase/acyltransferase domain-containing protein [Candidatus Moraniibacteriota bacterium]
MKRTIKRTLVSFLIFVFSLTPVSPQALLNFSQAIDAGGTIPTYKEWNESDNDINITENITIPKGHTLVINEGVKVNFSKKYLNIIVEGTLEIKGTAEKPVELKSNLEKKEEGFYIGTQVGSTVNIKNAKISGGGSEAFLVKGFTDKALAANYKGALQVDGGTVSVEDSTFENNLYAVLVKDRLIGSVKVNYSKFKNNDFDVEDNNGSDFTNNYWDNLDESSDSDSDESCGMVKTVRRCLSKSYGNFLIYPWQEDENFVHGGASNVLFLPGLKASRLYSDTDSICPYDGDNKKIAWEPNCNEDVQELFLNDEGESFNPNIITKEGDIIDETPIGSNIYKSFIEKMNSMRDVDGTINDWKPVAYDWRLSLEDILEDNLIELTLRDLAADSKTKKVTIVAHSNGGLLAKALMQKLGDEEGEKLVDKIIFVAVPQVGTPAAVAGLLHGEDQGFFPVLNTQTARGFGENMPGAYNLLPSDGYFSAVQTPIVSFDIDSDSEFKDRYADNIDSYDEMYEFLNDDFHRVSAINSEVDIPSRLNWNLLQKSENLHENLDLWSAPEGVNIVQIAGWGVPETLSETEYENKKENYCDEGICLNGIDTLDPDFKFTIDGDGTVITPSALWMSGENRYWINLDTYNKEHKLATFFGVFNLKHSNIFEIPELNSFIANNITNIEKPVSEYRYISAEVPLLSDKKRLQYSLHSPLTLELYDNKGRHTGINAEGQIAEQIPGTYFKQFGDVKYIFADEDISSYIKMSGYDTGTFTFIVKEFVGDEAVNKIIFKDMPVTPDTKVDFAVPADLESASNLEIDKDGDDVIDYSLEPKIGEIITLDTIAPATNNSIEGTQGNNSWYTSNVKFSLSATDEVGGSGVAKTQYSLDDGKTLIDYLEPIMFDQEGIFKIEYFSTDNNGNTEEVKEVMIKIDKAAPEAKLTFNIITQELDFAGIDNSSENISATIKEGDVIEPMPAENDKNKKNIFNFFQNLGKNNKRKTILVATLIDEAGHQTEIVWEKKKDKNNRIDLAILSISYDGNVMPTSENKVQYKWKQDWRRNGYLLFASHLSADSVSVETHYFPNKNQTWLMEKPLELSDEDSEPGVEQRPVWKKMTGMIIPSIITNKGELKINY